MVTAIQSKLTSPSLEVARKALDEVVDPEIPVLTIADIGILRDVRLTSEGELEVVITPTYSGCPAMNVIAFEIEVALARAGIDTFRLTNQLSPAWTTDWLTDVAREKMRAYGIAPPVEASTSKRTLFAADAARCPRCGSERTERVSEFGSSACKAQYRCEACKEPFDYFKCI